MKTPTRVLFVLYTNPAGYPPIEHTTQILRDHGFDVRVLGTCGLGSDSLEAQRLEGIDVRVVSRAGAGIVQKSRYAWFLLWVTAHLLIWRPRWLHASDPFTTPVALLATMLGFRVIYHEHDAPDRTPRSRLLQLILAARRVATRRAKVVVTPNEERSRVLSLEAGGRCVLTIWNCPARSDTRKPAPFAPDSDLCLVYQGSLVPTRLPFTVLQAMARTSARVTLQFTGIETVGAPRYGAALLECAASLQILDRVVRLPAMPRERMLDHTARGTLGLALMPVDQADENERNMTGASNKPFEYLACGLPILVSNLPDWRAVFVERGVAWSCDPTSIESIIAVLERAIAQRAHLAQMGAHGRTLIAHEWNYETRFKPLLELMIADREAAEALAVR